MEVADFGCGTGVLLLELARRFPNSRFYGSDISQQGIAIAEQHRASSGLTNVTFSRDDLLDLPAHLHGKFHWALTYDVVHDLSQPLKVCVCVCV